MERKLSSLLSLARAAGKVILGSDGVENAVKSGEAVLVFVASDASQNTVKRFKDKCSYYNTDICTLFSEAEINEPIGEYGKMVIAVTDDGFASAMKRCME